jgi:hypothetical protein
VRTYYFRDEWFVEAAPASVWELISQASSYPRWWPIYQEAEFLEDTGGVGSVVRLKFRVLLPYSLSIVATTTRSEPPRIAEGTVSGELEGTWRWTLEPERNGTRVTFEEVVGTRKWVLNLLAPVAYKLFELNHRVAAQRGAKGMRAYLARSTNTDAEQQIPV